MPTVEVSEEKSSFVSPKIKFFAPLLTESKIYPHLVSGCVLYLRTTLDVMNFLLREASDFPLVTQYLTSLEALTDSQYMVPLHEKNRYWVPYR